MSSVPIRSDLVLALEADLIGPFDPASGNETLRLPPSRWYVAGFIAPETSRARDDEHDPTDDDELGAGDDDDDGELPPAEPQPKRRVWLPSSIGLSVLLPPGPTSDEVTATVRWADYTPVEKPEPVDAQGDTNKQTPRDRPDWTRIARVPAIVPVPLDAAVLLKGIAIAGSDGLVLSGKLDDVDAPGLAKGTRALALFIVNRRQAVDRRIADSAFAFQVSLEVSFANGICARPNRQHDGAADFDDATADLQYRDHCEHAVGHGVSVETRPDDDGTVRRARTTWLPQAEVRRVETHESARIETRMLALAGLDDVDSALGPLVSEYGAWIALQAKLDVGDGTRKKVRARLVEEATRAQRRIEDGLALLKTDAVVREAFRVTNRAMAMAQTQRSGAKEPRWRLFQLAFVVMNLRSIAEPHHPDREIAELIFFPTGGGKTEAYLGVIAFTLVLRRFRRRQLPDQGLGVAVLLRYTLRLLTLDQLGRAATLMCALEVIRRGRTAELGDQRFAVGLWVGRKATANTLSEVARKITEYKNSTSLTAPPPFPLTECPWCKTAIEKKCFDLRPKPSSPEEVIVACVNTECPFMARKSPQGMPVLFVDEQIYKELPSFLVSTVDKFALLPWRGEAGKLFGKVSAREGSRFFGPSDGKTPKITVHLPSGLLPPELIVQDELHLISGPLGTMVGLYETAIDALSTHQLDGKPVRPKIIASTATVKRAREQIRSLFARTDACVFPPPGPNPMDTFFSRIDTASDGRLYVGVAAPGRASKAVMLRVYVALLAAAQKGYDKKKPGDQPADPYMTLVGYFNSLRELGGMRRLVEDEVRGRLREIELRKPEDWQGAHPWARERSLKEPVELTSRESTAKIGGVKSRMSKAHADDEHVDVVLASNMISVGVDIERLGLMVVAGQPKSTNEYIQATSRVGRHKDRPGLVVTVFNPVKPRDRSHYERFTAYHEAFYRFVEATSVTPFSGPALQRGLAAVVIGMVRHAESALTSSGSVMAIKEHRKHADELVALLADRAAGERANVSDADAEKLRTALVARSRNVLDSWENVVTKAREEGGDRCYSPWDPGKKGKQLLFMATEEDDAMSDDERKFAAPTSMRDVEPSVHVWVKRGPLGGRKPGR